jgi:hypothetical protein
MQPGGHVRPTGCIISRAAGARVKPRVDVIKSSLCWRKGTDDEYHRFKGTEWDSEARPLPSAHLI